MNRILSAEALLSTLTNQYRCNQHAADPNFQINSFVQSPAGNPGAIGLSIVYVDRLGRISSLKYFAFSLSSLKTLQSEKGVRGKPICLSRSVSCRCGLDSKRPWFENWTLLIIFYFFTKTLPPQRYDYQSKRKWRFNFRKVSSPLKGPKVIEITITNPFLFARRVVLIFVKPRLCIEIQCEKAVNKSESAFFEGRHVVAGASVQLQSAGGQLHDPFGKWRLEQGGSQLNHSLMATLKKTHKIRKLFPSSECPALDPPENETNVELQADSPEELAKPFKDEAPIKRSIKIDPRQISNLSEEERLKIRSEHPEMNEYFCMSARDKSKFFHLLNQKYRQEIKLPEPPGSAPMKKTIRFKKRFEIKPFGYLQKCDLIRNRKSFMELYRAKDDSKSKRLSKFPKNN